MADLDLEKKIEFALNDLVRQRKTFSLDEVNGYLGQKNKMDFKDIFKIAWPMLQEMNVSWHGEGCPPRIVVSAKEPFVNKVHVIQEYFPDFMEEGEWNIIINLFKEKGDIKWVKILGGLLAEYIQRNPELKKVDCIIPTPTNEEKLRETGYDSCLLLAKAVKEEMNIPIKKFFLKNHGTNFCELGDLKRKQKLSRSAFGVINFDIAKGKHVLLLDDIINSGTTLQTLVSLLEKAEAKKVDVLVLSKGCRAN